MAEYTVDARQPQEFSQAEKQDFISMVRAGGEVEGHRSLETNVQSAACLAMLRKGECLIGVGALKRPKETYRAGVETKTGIKLDPKEFPFEFGYLFILPSARGKGLWHQVWEALSHSQGGSGIFATARLNNDAMQAILPKAGFQAAGNAYLSSRGKYKVQLFLRSLSQQGTSSQ
jgi:hypothetical protein